jgi:hypothetical protein
MRGGADVLAICGMSDADCAAPWLHFGAPEVADGRVRVKAANVRAQATALALLSAARDAPAAAVEELSEPDWRQRVLNPEDSGSRRIRRGEEQLASHRRLAVFGAGRVARFAAALLRRHHEIVAFLDNDRDQLGRMIDGVEVRSPASLGTLRCDAILIAGSADDGMVQQLRQAGVPSGCVLRLEEVFERLVVFGAGQGGLQVFDSVPSAGMVLCFADSDPRRHGTLRNVPVVAPSLLRAVDHGYVLVASIHRDEIERQLLRAGVAAARILSIDPSAWTAAVQLEPRPDATERVRRFSERLAPADVARVVSFGTHCARALVLAFEPDTVAVGAALAASGCHVTALDAPALIDRLVALGIEAVATAPSVATVGPMLHGVSVLVAGSEGFPDWLRGRLLPTHKLIAPAATDFSGAHVCTDHLAFWYAPPRQWLAAPSLESRS